MVKPAEHTLEFLLEFNGRIHHLDRGYWLKLEIERVEPTGERPHGLRYSFTLHDPDGARLKGFGNAHAAQPLSSGFAPRSPAYDHWHRGTDKYARPYKFVDADTLLADFFAEVRRVLHELGISEEVVAVSEEDG